MEEQNIRDVRQREFAHEYVNSDRFGVLNLCARFGKCLTTIHILKALHSKTILISYPDTKIKKSWEKEFEQWGYENTEGIIFTTHVSLKKHIGKKYDIIILDEIHTLSENQLNVCEEIFELNKE